jgi:hypothetical protein
MTYVEDRDPECDGDESQDAPGAGDEERQPGEGEVEEGSEESFPASDPPSF